MNVTMAVFVCAVSANAVASEPTCPRMPKAVEAKLVPVLRALGEARRANNIWSKKYERAFGNLMAQKDATAKQAKVALMDYYVGEHFGGDLVCVVAMDDSRALLELYSACDIAPSKSSVERDRSLTLRQDALEILSAGNIKESCTFE